MAQEKYNRKDLRLSKEAEKWEKRLRFYRELEAKRKAEGSWLSGAEKHGLNSAIAALKKIPKEQLKINKSRSKRIAELKESTKGSTEKLASLEKALASLPSLRASQGNHSVASARLSLKGQIANLKRDMSELETYTSHDANVARESELQSQKAKLKQNVSTVEIATINDKLAKQKFNRNLLSDDDAQLVSDSFNMSQSITGGDRLEGIGLGKDKWPGPANAEDLKFDTSGESISGVKIKEKDGVATAEIPKKSWSDIKGMKRGRERDKLALEYYKDRGIDLQAKGGQSQRDMVKDLYIDNRVFVKDKGWTAIDKVEKGDELFHHSREGHNVTKGTY